MNEEKKEQRRSAKEAQLKATKALTSASDIAKMAPEDIAAMVADLVEATSTLEDLYNSPGAEMATVEEVQAFKDCIEKAIPSLVGNIKLLREGLDKEGLPVPFPVDPKAGKANVRRQQQSALAMADEAEAFAEKARGILNAIGSLQKSKKTGNDRYTVKLTLNQSGSELSVNSHGGNGNNTRMIWGDYTENTNVKA